MKSASKLTLDKSTVTELSSSMMKSIVGGTAKTAMSCATKSCGSAGIPTKQSCNKRSCTCAETQGELG